MAFTTFSYGLFCFSFWIPPSSYLSPPVFFLGHRLFGFFFSVEKSGIICAFAADDGRPAWKGSRLIGLFGVKAVLINFLSFFRLERYLRCLDYSEALSAFLLFSFIFFFSFPM